MGVLRLDRLVITDAEFIRTLLTDLATVRKPMAVEAPELEPGTTLKIKAVKDQHFLVEVDTSPDEALALPMSSWRVRVSLTGAELALTTASLARTDTQTFCLGVPDEIVTGSGRRHYRVLVVGQENFQVTLQTTMDAMQADVIDASFGGAKLRLSNAKECRVDIGQRLQMGGRHRGIMFKESVEVNWREGDRVGVSLIEGDELEQLETRPWSHVVRRMAYDFVMKQARPAA